MTANFVAQGKEYGIDFRFDKAHSFNTFNAHGLIHWANTFGKSHELKEAFMLHYFKEGLNLFMANNLIVVVKKVGLIVVEARHVLNSDRYTIETEADILLAKERGIPYFITNGESTISGAQRDKVFENTLAAALEKLPPTNNMNQQGVCNTEGKCK